jgi:hypothetical protein
MFSHIRNQASDLQSLNVKCRATYIRSYNSWFLHIFAKSIFEKAISRQIKIFRGWKSEQQIFFQVKSALLDEINRTDHDADAKDKVNI